VLCAIPMEIVGRELDAGLYLALHLAKRGHSSLLGERMVPRYVLASGRPVFYIDIEQHAPTNRKIIEAGGYVLNLNPEGFSFVKNPKFVSTLESLHGAVSSIGLWGERQMEVVRDHLPKDMADTLHVVGHPSFDLLNERFIPYYENPSIIDAHGTDYILINTNFAIANHAMGYGNYSKMMQKMDEWKIFNDPNHIRHRERKGEYQQDIMGRVVELAHRLSERYPDRKIVVRPHPAENKDYYHKFFEDRPNIVVQNGGSVREWIASAGAVLHHDCTTSIEALLMGKLVIQYRPVLRKEYVDPLLTGFGLPAESFDEVCSLLKKKTMPVEAVDAQCEQLKPYLANVGNSSVDLLSTMASDLSAQCQDDWMPRPLNLWGQIKCWRKHLSKVIRARQPGRNGRKVRYALSKFPRLPRTELVRRVDKLRSIEPALPAVSIEQLALNTFVICPEKADQNRRLAG